VCPKPHNAAQGAQNAAYPGQIKRENGRRYAAAVDPTTNPSLFEVPFRIGSSSPLERPAKSDAVKSARSVDKYHVEVSQHTSRLWGWEIYRNGEPLPVALRAAVTNLRALPERPDGSPFVSS
jgi:hypothetical protein